MQIADQEPANLQHPKRHVNEPFRHSIALTSAAGVARDDDWHANPARETIRRTS
jgi:hypothetical protein